MMSRVEWCREAVLALIKVYEKNPCLWDNKHICYKNREKNKEAVAEMTEAVKVYHPEVTDDDCRTKYQNLRGQFSREYAKLLELKKQSDSEDLPRAKFWCYYKLQFLKDNIRQKGPKYMERASPEKNDEEYKMEYMNDTKNSDEDYSYKIEYLDHNYVEYETVTVQPNKKRKLEEPGTPNSTDQENADIIRISKNNVSQTENPLANIKEIKKSKINKNMKIGELLAETLNECTNKEKRKWAQKEVLNIIVNLIDVDSDDSEEI